MLGKPVEEWSHELCESFITSAIEDADKNILKKLELCNKWIVSESNWANAWYEKEKTYWDKFVKIVQRKNNFFSIKHVDKIGLKYDILIFLGKKNIGKSCEIYRLMQETIEKGKKFIYIRYSRNELDKSVEGFNTDSFSPVYMVHDKSVWKFYDRNVIRQILKNEDDEPNRMVTPQWVKARGVPLVGYAYEFCYCQSYTGGQYEDFEYIFYDECLTYDPRNSLNDRHLSNWAAFLSSIARNKPNLKVFLFGNLQATNNQILEFYGINRDDRLRYIARGGEEEGCRILFINGGDLYRGYDAQTRAARHAGGEYALKLEGNEYLITSSKLIPPRAFNAFTNWVYFYWGGFLFNIRHFTFIKTKKKVWAVSAKTFSGFEKFENRKILTDDRVALLKYANLSYIPSLMPYIQKIQFMIWTNSIRFTDEESLSTCGLLYEEDPYRLNLNAA